MCPSHRTLYCLLQFCVAKQDVVVGRKVHSFIIRKRLETNAFLANHLIRMYAYFGSLEEANQVFRNVLSPDKFVWAAIIAANGKLGEANVALELYFQMRCSTVEPNEHVFVAVLNACATARALATGRLVHTHILSSAWAPSVYVGNSLINMYAKCGMLDEARNVFDKQEKRDLFTWNTMITGYALHELGEEAGQLFYDMQEEGHSPDIFTVIGVLKGWASLEAFDHGRLIHAYVRRRGVKFNEVVVSNLIHMYARCGSLSECRRLFDRLDRRDVVTWSSIIAAHVGNNCPEEALELFQQMQAQEVKPDNFILSSILKACSSVAAFDLGKLVHAYVLTNGYESDIVIANSLIDFYGKCGSLRTALQVFNRLVIKDVVTWTTLISGYAQNGDAQVALQLFHLMLQEGMQPGRLIHASMLKACASIEALDEGRRHHSFLVGSGLESDELIGNTLIDMYSKCGSPGDARRVFDRLPEKGLLTWNSIIVACTQNGGGDEALALFEQMQMEGLQPDQILVTSILNACSSLGALEQGKLLHALALRNGFLSDPLVAGSVVDMYVKSGNLLEARSVFDMLPVRDAVSWSALITGYVEDGDGQEVLLLFDRMQEDGLCPDSVTLASTLKACSNSTALPQGKALHFYIVKNGLDRDLFISSSLIDMYVACGNLTDARRVFDSMSNKNCVSWNALIAGYASHGESQVAFELFHEMIREGVHPDKVTFICLLSACSHSCLVEKALSLFTSFPEEFGIKREKEHFGCMVDLLGRAGYLYEAEQLIHSIPSQADTIIWTALLGACRTHGNLTLGIRCFEAILKLDVRNSAAYVLMSGIYADAGKWDDKAAIRLKMLQAGVQKEPGRTWVDADDTLHSFVVNDQEHQERGEIHDTLRFVTRLIVK